MRKINDDHWQKLLQEVKIITDGEGFELWHIEFHPQGGRPVLRVYIDKPDGITIDECALVSNQISMMLDVEDIISDKYTLEVSSPGLDRKLVKPEHFERYISKNVKIKLRPDFQGRKKFSGSLKSFVDGIITLVDEKEGQEHKIDIQDVHVARLAIDI